MSADNISAIKPATWVPGGEIYILVPLKGAIIINKSKVFNVAFTDGGRRRLTTQSILRSNVREPSALKQRIPRHSHGNSASWNKCIVFAHSIIRTSLQTLIIRLRIIPSSRIRQAFVEDRANTLDFVPVIWLIYTLMVD